MLTFYECGHAESFCNAFGDVFEREFYAYAHIAAATLARLTAAAFCTAEAAEVKSGAEYTVKYIVDIESAGVSASETASEAAHAARAHSVAILVVEGFFLFVAENVVCLGRFFEFFFGSLVARIAVGVIFEGQLTVGLLYFVGSGRLGHAEHFVVVSLFIHIGYVIRLRPLWRDAELCR